MAYGFNDDKSKFEMGWKFLGETTPNNINTKLTVPEEAEMIAIFHKGGTNNYNGLSAVIPILEEWMWVHVPKVNVDQNGVNITGIRVRTPSKAETGADRFTWVSIDNTMNYDKNSSSWNYGQASFTGTMRVYWK